MGKAFSLSVSKALKATETFSGISEYSSFVAVVGDGIQYPITDLRFSLA